MSIHRRVTVVDHGAGNIRSVVRALGHVGADVTVTGSAEEVARSDRIVVPGQGAFGDCMRRLVATGLDDVIRRHIEAERPYLGICLGLQVLFDVGHEHGTQPGLGVLPGECVPFSPTLLGHDGARLKIPHMGWNTVRWDGTSASEWFYFVHSYVVVPTGAGQVECARTDHGQTFVSAVRTGSLLAVQFHPEKSQQAGLALLEGFMQGQDAT